ncbi:PIN domain-containing protein [bacterium]|nr:PIN domain-containing protein [bacterium]
MEKITRKSKIFLDTSVVLSGLNSPFGASAFILTLGKIGRISIIISPEIIDEAGDLGDNLMLRHFLTSSL